MIFEYDQMAANKMPVWLRFDNQYVEIYRCWLTVRLRALAVLSVFASRHWDSEDSEDFAVIIFDLVVHTPGWDTGPKILIFIFSKPLPFMEEPDLIKEFLLAEHLRYDEMFRFNEKTGEKRLTFFLTLSAAVMGAVVKLYDDTAPIVKQGQLVPLLVLTALSGLLLVGLLIYKRLIRRNEVTEAYKNNLDQIRNLFNQSASWNDKTLLKYNPKFVLPRSYSDKNKIYGLKDIVAVINLSLLLFTICIFASDIRSGIISIGPHIWLRIIYGLLYLILSIPVWIQARVLIRDYKFLCWPKIPTHAGCVVYRLENGISEYLIISSTDSSDDWVLPKGHIESRESPKAAAKREVSEETGFEGEIEANMGITRSYIVNKEKERVTYFLMKTDGKPGPAKEKRRLEWVDLDTAIERIVHKEAKNMLEKLK